MAQLIKTTDAQTEELCSVYLRNKNTVNKKTPTNNIFPPCNADNTVNFRTWNNKVIIIISTAEWADLYDTSTKDIVLDGSIHPSLYNHLYSSLSNVMSKNNTIIMQQKRHICQDSVQYYRTLQLIYQMKLSSLKVQYR